MALIDELKERADKLDAEMLALSGRLKEIERESDAVHICINALDIAEMDEERAADADLDMAALEAPAQLVHPDELRDAPPAASEEEKETSDNQPCTCHPDDAPPVCQRLYAASQCQTTYYDKMKLVASAAPAEDFTLLDPAVLRDAPEIPEGFTKWEGGYCPLEIGTEAEVLTRKCGTWHVTTKPEAPLLWEHEGHDLDIVGYRIIYTKAEPGTQHEVEAITIAPHVYTEGGHSITHEQPITVFAERADEPEGYAPVVDAEPNPIDAAVEKGAITQDEAELVLDATELAQVTIDKVPPTAEVIKDRSGRAKFALFGGQTHEVVEPSNTEADFWARALFPKKKEQA